MQKGEFGQTISLTLDNCVLNVLAKPKRSVCFSDYEAVWTNIRCLVCGYCKTNKLFNVWIKHWSYCIYHVACNHFKNMRSSVYEEVGMNMICPVCGHFKYASPWMFLLNIILSLSCWLDSFVLFFVLCFDPSRKR